MELDWDLHAVVRSYTSSITSSSSSTTTTTTTTSTNNNNKNNPKSSYDSSSSFVSPQTSCFGSTSSLQQQHVFTSFQHPVFEARNNGVGDLHELFKPFSHKSINNPTVNNFTISPQPTKPISSSSSVISINHQLKQHSKHTVSNTSATTPRSKRRKNQQKKVCQVAAEDLSSDVWAWRKYGQKPIKGSPYPRGYYRCSSSKGCLARKQVERNRSDPGMFIVTYTAEHNHPAPTHRNSLAGSTRQKTTSQGNVTGSDSNKPSTPKQTSSSPTTSLDQSKDLERDLVEEDEEVEFDGGDEDCVGDFCGFSEVVSDDFFVGLENLDSPVAGECFPDKFPVNFGLPWIVNNAATTAGGLL